MLITFYENSKITQQQVINSNLELYLDSLNKIDIDNFNFQKITTKNFSIVIQKNEFTNFNLKKIDLCRVFEYKFLDVIWTYFNLKKIEFLNENQFKLEFEINLLQTFSLNNIINADQQVHIYRSHLNYKNQFNIDDTIKNNSILLTSQPTGQFNYLINNYKNLLNNEKQKLMTDASGIQKWVVATINKDYSEQNITGEVIHLKKSKDNENDSKQQVEKSYITIFSPLTSISNPFDIVVTDPKNDNIFQSISFSGKNTINLLKILQDDNVPFINIIDNWAFGNYARVIINSSNGEASVFFNKEREDGGFDISPAKAFYNNSSFDEPLGIYLENIYNEGSQWTILNDLTIQDSATDNDLLYKESPNRNIGDKWTFDEEEILNFYPFKKIEMGLENETFGSGLSLNQEHFKKFKIGDIPVKYSYSFTPFSTTFNFYKNEIYQTQEITKISRSFSINKSVDQWLSFKQNQAGGAVGDYLIPFSESVIGASLAAFTGGFKASAGAALIVNSGIQSVNTFLSHKTIQNKPNPVSSAGVDLENEIHEGYNFSTIKILKPSLKEIESTAFDFYKRGLHKFDYPYFKSQFINEKKLFNYIQISNFENINILNSNINFYYKEDYLNLLKKGFWSWKYYPENPETIFDFSYSNPDNI